MIHNDEREQAFLTSVKSALDEEADQLDELTVARLRAARKRAVAVSATRSPHWLVWGGVAATAAVVVLSVSLWMVPPVSEPGASPLEDLDIISAAEGLEFYQDMDFYLWVADEQELG